jgi:hypothetical protein
MFNFYGNVTSVLRFVIGRQVGQQEETSTPSHHFIYLAVSMGLESTSASSVEIFTLSDMGKLLFFNDFSL